MPKMANKYLEVEPWAVVERTLHRSESRVSESIFALGNEYMGVRGYFDEGYSGDTVVGSYLNGVWEERHGTQVPVFRGIVDRQRFMVNNVDWLYTRISVGGETLDLAKSAVTDFVRRLDLKAGTLTREFVWRTATGKRLRLRFERFVSMVRPNLGAQRITITPLNFSGTVRIAAGLDFSPEHELWHKNYWTVERVARVEPFTAILGKTVASGQRTFSCFRLEGGRRINPRVIKHDKFTGTEFSLRIKQGEPAAIDKIVVNLAEKRPQATAAAVWSRGLALAQEHADLSFEDALAEHRAWWARTWETSDVVIEGDPATQQGTRFCIFQMHQTYHGVDPTNNVGAKGLTGAQYCGHTFWDTETYCLPFYIFNNPKAAHNLLGYRHRTLPQALERARELDCEGARYPMSTIDGTESCDVWQHGDLQIHVSGAVAYGIWHYARVCKDEAFLHREGIEMLLQVCRYFASRGAWSQATGEFGFWGVMGPDEFHMMVHNDYYTNALAKKMIEYTLRVVAGMRRAAPAAFARAAKKVELRADELSNWRRIAKKMRLPRDPKTGLPEQFDGYFNLPHTNVAAIPVEQFPIYKHWAYVRIFRGDMIKQPDVLLLPFFFSEDYTPAEKRAIYEYYEPRCIHESSLSPGIHAIMAAELGKFADARKYSLYAARLDLDNYNRNTHEGLHTTSMAAAWMNVVYGCGGMRSDGDALCFRPSMPKRWKSFAFRVRYRGSLLSVRVDRKAVELRTLSGPPIAVKVFGRPVKIAGEGTRIALPAARRG